jgi:hypothetical protein
METERTGNATFPAESAKDVSGAWLSMKLRTVLLFLYFSLTVPVLLENNLKNHNIKAK